MLGSGESELVDFWVGAVRTGPGLPDSSWVSWCMRGPRGYPRFAGGVPEVPAPEHHLTPNVATTHFARAGSEGSLRGQRLPSSLSSYWSSLVPLFCLVGGRYGGAYVTGHAQVGPVSLGFCRFRLCSFDFGWFTLGVR